jgi:pimeloyl-ACP methyl ester carboxylesterase
MTPDPALTEQLGDVTLDGARLRYAVSGSPTATTTLLLVHGAGAHRRWWDRVTPLLADQYQMISLDLGGHGDSDWRSSYGPSTFGREVLAAADLVDGPVTLVGHSMGGRACVVAASRAPEKINGLLMLDTLFPLPGTRPDRADEERRVGTYDDETAARSRFRLVPPQPRPSTQELDELIGYALTVRDGRWCWKFDPMALWRFEDEVVEAALRKVTCPMTYVFGGQSRVRSAAAAARIAELHPAAEVTEVPDGFHHLPLDSPREVAAAVRRTAERAEALTPPVVR